MISIEAELYSLYLSQILSKKNIPTSVLQKETKRIHAYDLIEKYDAFFFDAFGTLYNRHGFVYPGAVEFIEILKQHHKEVRLVTNSATQTAADLSKEILSFGFSIPQEHIFSSGKFLFDWAEKFDFNDCFYLGREIGKSVVEAGGVRVSENPTAPIVVVSSNEKNEKRLAQATEILKRPGAICLALNPDACAPETDGSRSEVSGICAFRLAKRTNCRFEVCGKPFSKVFEQAIQSVLQTLSPNTSNATPRILMVGDTLGTDIVGANAALLDSCLIMGRNVTEESYVQDSQALQNVSPDYIISSF